MSNFLKLIQENSEQWYYLTEDLWEGVDLHEIEVEDEDGEESLEANFLVKNGYEVEVIERTGGEGCGEEHHVTIKVTKDNEVTYYVADGYYMSYEGFSNDMDFYEAVPVEVTYTEYHRKA